VKDWARLNINPEILKPLKQIALDQDKYIYEVIEELVKTNYTQYFKSY
jgi:hypothetical protein